MRYALVEDNIVTNIIWLDANCIESFPNAVATHDIPVHINDTYENGIFYRNGERVLTNLERAEQTIAELDQVLLDTTYQNIIGELE